MSHRDAIFVPKTLDEFDQTLPLFVCSGVETEVNVLSDKFEDYRALLLVIQRAASSFQLLDKRISKRTILPAGFGEALLYLLKRRNCGVELGQIFENRLESHSSIQSRFPIRIGGSCLGGGLFELTQFLQLI